MRGILRMGILSALISLGGGGQAMSDTAKGIAAYQRGDYPRAMKELQASADKGDEQAYYNLGVAYAEGKAGPRDMAKAIAAYRKGAEGGSPLAAFSLGQVYRKGDGTERDYSEAAKWYEIAAKHGDYRASNELGLLYVEGKGVEKSLIEGFAWIYPATHASIMDDNALKNAMQLASMLTKAQLDEAQTKGRAYFDEYFEPNSETVNAILEGQR
ncbi:sel1 repeat family protein [Rhizobium sp. XQZ8]|uniref:tetratricopeptide repeat protein n=1 Tax=Rhizobium populisoli TaxID=2859785 RepID=UPI001CA5D242|nr:tetratricopeptide repeat protein [Rhizobium populisoli]MBW6424524.1 sel1 repeat family protein [Rhizobium populisoli]